MSMMDLQWVMAVVLGLGLLFGAGMVLSLQARESRKCRERRRQGIALGGQLKQLQMDLQQHRGMINALLSGDRSFAAKVRQKQDSIDRDMGTLDAVSRHSPLTARRWEAVRSQWDDLRANAAALAAEDSFARHSLLIREILRCMGDVAERTQLGGMHPLDPTLVSVLWSELPAAAECIGQARGMGASVAAKGYCSSDSRIKLGFLEERIRETMSKVSTDLGHTHQQLATGMSQRWQEASAVVGNFLNLLESSLLNAEHPALDAEHYFATATQALAAVFQVFDQTTAELERAALR